MVGWLPLFAPASGFNGGKSQINLNFLQNGGEYPFMNFLLIADAWSFADGTGWPAPNTLNPDGYPLNSAMTNGGVQTVFQIPTQTERSGDYVVITTGTGTIFGSAGLSASVSGSNTQTIVSGASLGSTTSFQFYITATDATTPITKAAFVHSSDVTAYIADNLAFGTKFINILQQAKPGVLRFLNWQNGNFTNETNWASRKPQTHWSFSAAQFPAQRTDSGLGCQVGWLGTTTSSGNDYAISDSIGSAAPVDKQTILLNFDAAAVTVASGANAQITWSGHGLVTGSPFFLFTSPAGSAPGGVTIYSGGPVPFYAIVVDSSHIKFATTYANAIANTAITTSSTGSGVYAHATVMDSPVTATIGGTNLSWPHHQMTTGDCFCFSGNTGDQPASNVSTGINYYAIVVDADNIKAAISKANALASIAITFTGSASGSPTAIRQPTLNLNGTGAIPIRGIGGSGMTFLSNWLPAARIYQTHITYGALTYDSVLNAWIKYGGDVAVGGPMGIASSVPPEVCLKLCKQIGAHPYFVSGYLTLDPLTDYQPSLMQFCKDNAPAWMIPRFEGFNEDWNSVCPGSIYSQYKSFALWAVKEFPGHDYVGKYCSVLGQAANNVWSGGKGTSYHVLVNVQTTSFTDSTTAAASDHRLTSASYVAQAAAPQSPYAKDPAYKWCSHVACAQYVTPSLYGTTAGGTNESSMASTWTANGSLANDPLLTQYVDALSGVAAGFNLAACALNYTTIYTWAQGAGVSGGWNGIYKLGMCGYEGGYSPSLFNTGAGNIAEVYNFRVASKFVSDVGKALTGGTFSNASVVAGTYNDFTVAGGIFPSCFQLGGGTGNGGFGANAWSVLDPDIYLSPQPSQWTAIVAYNL